MIKNVRQVGILPVVISEIVNIELSKTITAETCNENDGFLKVVASNGEGSYDFILVSTNHDSIFKFADTFMVDTLVEGTYFLIVNDDSSCVKIDTISIESVIPFQISSLNKVVERLAVVIMDH